MPTANTAVPLDENGRERPAFVMHYPQEDARLNALVAAFERGDFKSVTQGATALLSQASSVEVRDAAQDLLRRTQPHPLIVLFLGSAVALFLFFAIWVYTI